MVSAEARTTQERLLDDWVRHWSSHDLDQLVVIFSDKWRDC